MRTFVDGLDLLPQTEKIWLRKQRRKNRERSRNTLSSRFLRFQREVIQESLDDTLFAITLGARRERIALGALRILKKNGRLVRIIQTTKFSWADLVEDIDIYVVYLADNRLTVAKLSIGGPSDVVERTLKHPDNVVITVLGTESEHEMADIIAGALGI